MLSQQLINAGFQLLSLETPQVVFHPVFGTIDFSKLTVEQAADLVSKGYAGLTKITSKVIEEVIVPPTQTELPSVALSETGSAIALELKTQNPKLKT